MVQIVVCHHPKSDDQYDLTIKRAGTHLSSTLLPCPPFCSLMPTSSPASEDDVRSSAESRVARSSIGRSSICPTGNNISHSKQVISWWEHSLRRAARVLQCLLFRSANWALWTRLVFVVTVGMLQRCWKELDDPFRWVHFSDGRLQPQIYSNRLNNYRGRNVIQGELTVTTDFPAQSVSEQHNNLPGTLSPPDPSETSSCRIASIGRVQRQAQAFVGASEVDLAGRIAYVLMVLFG